MKENAKLEKVLFNLYRFISNSDYSGYDPYDGLNSKFIRFIPYLRNKKIFRQFWIQFFKRSPVNLRSLFLVKKERNPKGIALLISGLLNIYNKYQERGCLKDVENLAAWLINHRSPYYDNFCWGYNFDWQSRAFFVPKAAPSVVASTFCAHAFLDVFVTMGKEKYLEIAQSTCKFILNDLNISEKENSICFSYTPSDSSQVHNVNFLGASLLARVYFHNKDDKLLDFAYKAVKFSADYQNEDGSWYYGNAPNQKWIDNFHTGYNLIALNDFIRFSGNMDFHNHFEKGFTYYKNNFFLENGIPKYYYNKIYPIDIHNVAQGIITFAKLKDKEEGKLDKAQRIAKWATENMLDKKGFFYFQKNRYFTNKIPYIRWSQAWMFYALSQLIERNR